MSACCPGNLRSSFTSYGSAIKVREYLVSGKPIVMAPLFEYLQTPGLRFYSGTDQFIACVEDALANDSAADRELRQSTVRNCTWDRRARELGELMQKLLAAGTPANDPGLAQDARVSPQAVPQTHSQGISPYARNPY